MPLGIIYCELMRPLSAGVVIKKRFGSGKINFYIAPLLTGSVGAATIRMAITGGYLKKVRDLTVTSVNDVIQGNLPRVAAIITPPLKMVNAKPATPLTVHLIKDY